MADADSTLEQLINTYCAAWSDPDPQRRRALLSQVWADGATYTDPTVHAAGAEELLAHIETVFAQRPGMTIVRTSKVDAHHGVARFAWHAVLADGTALPDGIDFVEFDGVERIRRIVGFMGPVAPAE